MSDASGKLAERSELLGLNQTVLRGAEVVEGLRELIRSLAQLVEQARVFDRDDGLAGKTAQQCNLLVIEWQHFAAVDSDGAD